MKMDCMQIRKASHLAFTQKHNSSFTLRAVSIMYNIVYDGHSSTQLFTPADLFSSTCSNHIGMSVSLYSDNRTTPRYTAPANM